MVDILGGDLEPGLSTEGHPGSVPSLQFLWSWIGPHIPSGSPLLSRWARQQGHVERLLVCEAEVALDIVNMIENSSR